MSVITVNGQQVDVGDAYDKLSPAEQQDTQAEIAQQLGHHEEAQQETTKKEEDRNAPVAPFDVSNSQSAVRQYAIDPALAAGSAFGHPAWEAAKTVASHPIESSIAASYIPGVNKLPLIRDVKNAREAIMNKYVNAKTGLNVFDKNATTGGAAGGETPMPSSPGAAGAGSNLAEQADAWKTLNTPANELNGRPAAPTPEYNVPKANVPNMPPRQGGPLGFQGTNPNGAYSPRVPTAGPVAPGGTPAAGSVAPRPVAPPPVGGAPAAQAETFLSRLASQYGSVAQKVAPVIEKVMANPIVNNPVTRFAGSKAGMGLQLALHSGELNSDEEEQIRKIHARQDQMKRQGLIK